MRLHATRTGAPALGRTALALIGALIGGLVCAALPSTGLQLAFVVAASVGVFSLALGRLEKTLDPAWVLVSLLYLVGPVGVIVHEVGIGVSTVAIIALAPTPFVLLALLLRPERRTRLVRVAPFLLLVIFAGLSLLWSPNPTVGLDKLAVLILTGLLPAAFLLVLARTPSDVGWWLIAMAAVISALAVIVFGEYSALYPDRVSVFGDNPIWSARAAFIGVLVLIFGPFHWLARLVAIPVLIFAGALTVSLGPAIGLVMGALAGTTVALYQMARANRRVMPAAVGIALLCGLAVVGMLGDVFFSSTSLLSKVVFNDPNVTGRAAFIGAAVPLFLQAPLGGVGVGGFAVTDLAAYPHNLVVEIAAELGLLGLLAYAAWLALALRGAMSSPLLTALVVATTFYSLFSGSLASNVEFWLFSALAVATVPIGARRVRQPPEGPVGDGSRLDVVATI